MTASSRNAWQSNAWQNALVVTVKVNVMGIVILRGMVRVMVTLENFDGQQRSTLSVGLTRDSNCYASLHLGQVRLV